MRRVFLVVAAASALGACAAGLPWGREPDPAAPTTLADAQPLIRQCHDSFAAALGSTPVSYDSGPTVESDGDFRRITLEARSTDPDALHPYHYECRFEAGKLVTTQMQH